MTLKVARSTSPACAPGLGAQLLVFLNRRRAAPARRRTPGRPRRRRPGDVADLRVLESGTAPSSAPASAPAGRGPRPARAPSRTAAATPWPPVSGTTRRDAPRAAADPLEDASERADQRRPVVDVGRRQRRDERPLGQRLEGVRRDDRLPAVAARWPPPTRGGWPVSTATVGAGRLAQGGEEAHSTKVTLLISRSVVDALHDAFDRGLAQEPHALLARRLLDLGGRPLLENQLADVIGQVEQLADGRPALVAGAAALDAAEPLVEDVRVLERRIEARFLEQRARHRRRPLAVRADRRARAAAPARS